MECVFSHDNYAGIIPSKSLKGDGIHCGVYIYAYIYSIHYIYAGLHYGVYFIYSIHYGVYICIYSCERSEVSVSERAEQALPH